MRNTNKNLHPQRTRNAYDQAIRCESANLAGRQETGQLERAIAGRLEVCDLNRLTVDYNWVHPSRSIQGARNIGVHWLQRPTHKTMQCRDFRTNPLKRG